MIKKLHANLEGVHRVDLILCSYSQVCRVRVMARPRVRLRVSLEGVGRTDLSFCTRIHKCTVIKK